MLRTIDITKGVIIDGYKVGYGAAMANHSCVPNTILEHEYFPGEENAPIGMLRALKDIDLGDELECSYGYWKPERDGMPNISDLNSYVPCRCLRPQCKKNFKLKQRYDFRHNL